MSLITEANRAVEIFYSYAHEDERWRKKLETHLSTMRRQGLISGWNDRNISVGAEWKQEINRHLDMAQIILLLVSPDFIASDYCYSIEMNRALERHDAKEASVIPIILRPVDLTGIKFAKLQALPTNAKPITTWRNQDEAFLDVAKGIREAVGKLTTNLETTSNVANSPQKTQEQLVTEAKTLRNARKYQEAIDIYDQIIHVYPKYLPAHFYRIWLLTQLGRYKEAMDAFFLEVTKK